MMVANAVKLVRGSVHDHGLLTWVVEVVARD